jgi:hypothetical protein
MEMKRLAVLCILVLAFVLIANSSISSAQGTFTIPFKFQAGGKKFPAGEYSVAQKGDGQVTLRKEPGGEEVLIPFKERLPQPDPPLAEPQLIFDAVGNFEPSYTEYVTDYLLAEVWLPGEEGFLIHTTKGAHQNKIIQGQKTAK